VKAVTATLSASSIQNPAAALVDVVPVTLDGTKYGEQKITSGSKTVAPVSKSVAGAVSLTSPSLALTATTVGGPVARLTSATVGSASVLGLQLPAFTGSLNFGSSVVSKTADASKTVQVKAFSLPSLRDLLGALGFDISRLPIATLQSLVNKLNLATSAITTAESALAALPAATTLVTTRTTALETALGNANAVLGTIPTTAAAWQALDSAAQGVLLTALGALPGGTALVTAINTADAALSAAQSALTALQNLAAALPALLLNALDTPLLSIGDVTIGTVAQAGAKHVAHVTGTVKGVSVLGNQLVNSTDVVALATTALATLTSQINALTQTVGSVLHNVNVIGSNALLNIPAPKITLLQKSTSLSPSGAYQAASAQVIGAAVSWGAMSIPVSEALIGATPKAARPNLSIVNGVITTDPMSVTVADLTDASRYAPAAATTTPTTVTPGTTTPGLASTGVSTGVAVGALLLMLAAFGVRRLRSATTVSE
jgi:hypothetical protein